MVMQPGEKQGSLLASPRGRTEKHYLGFPKEMTQLDFSKIKSSPVHTLRTFNMFFSFPLKYEPTTSEHLKKTSNKRTESKPKEKSNRVNRVEARRKQQTKQNRNPNN